MQRSFTTPSASTSNLSLYARAAFIAAVGALTLHALRLRLAGFDPPSLWLDDEWVGIVVRRMRYADFFRLKPPVPIGFVTLEKLAARVSSDPEWPLQLLPLACSLIQVPLTAALVLSITRRRSMAIVGAALAAVCPMSAELSIRVKQYALDGVIITGLLLAGAPLLSRWDITRAWKTAFGAALAALFSFPSVFVSVPLLHLALLRHQVLRGRSQRPELTSAAIVLTLDVALAIVWATLLRGQSSPAMLEYWSAWYMPLTPGPAVQFLRERGWEALRNAFPRALTPAVALLPLGVVGMAVHPKHRGLATLLALFPLQLIVASALRLYPLGGGRTDSFAHPLLILCVASGLSFVLGPIRSVLRRKWNATTTESGITIATALAAMIAAVAVGTPARYPSSGDAEVIRAARELIKPSDGLIIGPDGTIGVGYYGGWRIEFIPWAGYAHNFHVVFDRPDTLALNPYSAYRNDQPSLARELAAFLATPRSRLVYVAASRAHGNVHTFILKRLRKRGYQVEQNRRVGTSEVVLLVTQNR